MDYFNQTFEQNASRCASNVNMPIDVVIYGTLFYSLIFFIGTFGNILVIFVLARDQDLRNFTNYLLANLSVADLMVLFSNVPTGLHDLFAKERWFLGKLWCHSVFFVENTMVFASILTIFFITCDRYYVICKPLNVKSMMNQNRTLKLIIFLWTISLIVNLPFIYFSEYNQKSFFDCTIAYKCELTSNSLFFYYIIITNFLFFFIIGLILLVMYYRIYQFLNKSNDFLMTCSSRISLRNHLSSISSDIAFNNISRRRSRNMRKKMSRYSLFQMNELAKVNESEIDAFLYKTSDGNLISFRRETNTEEVIVINRYNKFGKYIQQRKKIVGMLVALISVFYLCLFPLKIWNLIIMIFGTNPGFYKLLGLNMYWYINVSCRILFYLNSSINPILYNWFSKRFRKNFCNIISIPKFFIFNS